MSVVNDLFLFEIERQRVALLYLMDLRTRTKRVFLIIFNISVAYNLLFCLIFMDQ